MVYIGMTMNGERTVESHGFLEIHCLHGLDDNEFEFKSMGLYEACIEGYYDGL